MPDVIAVVESPEIPPEDDEFSQAFAQLSVANDAARGGEAPPKPEPASREPVVEAPEVVGEDTSLPDETRKAEAAPEPQAPEPPKPQSPQLTNEELARIAAISQQVAKSQQPAPPPAPQVQQPQQDVSPYNQDEIALINEYMTEYPEIARAEALSRRKDIFDAVRYVLGEVNRALGPTVQEVNRIAQRTHVGDLQQLVPDYNITREQAIEWTQKQPAYLQPAYYHVIQRGTPEEIAHFTQLYRASVPAPGTAAASNGHAAAAVSRTAPPAQPTPAERRAVAALAPVAAKRSGISAEAIEPNNFDDAFERWAKQADQARR